MNPQVSTFDKLVDSLSTEEAQAMLTHIAENMKMSEDIQTDSKNEPLLSDTQVQKSIQINDEPFFIRLWLHLKSFFKALPIEKVYEEANRLIDSYNTGKKIKEGIKTVIVGKPNVGKSTLLNALLHEERAIVTHIAGTTRDTIEEILNIEGTAFRFIDTAGIRETTDVIEEIGVKKAKEKIETAQILLYLYDEFDSNEEEVIDFVKGIYRKDLKIILLQNKIDLAKSLKKSDFHQRISSVLSPNYTTSILEISAKNQIDAERIKQELSNFVESLKSQENNVIITNQRHYEALQKALDSVKRVEEAITYQIHTELLAYELKSALEHLGEISGEFTNDEVLGNIFSKFCIGK